MEPDTADVFGGQGLEIRHIPHRDVVIMAGSVFSHDYIPVAAVSVDDDMVQLKFW
jgi:hypothetical protein